MKIKWWEVLITVAMLYLAFLGGFAKADTGILDTTEDVIIAVNDIMYEITDEWENVLESIIPHENMSLYVDFKDREIGVRISF